MPDQASRLAAALAARYRIERELGSGGMATVYLATDVKHQRPVALKVLRPELAAVIGAERFLHEIRVTANLQHPHILPLHDSGEADGFLYYVMPYIEGETLSERLERERQLPVAEAVQLAREVASALDYAHRQGIIHRDIKPENVLLHDGNALVADFGIALALSQAGGSRFTQTGLSLGTPRYMSPEQAAGERDVTARSDEYSLAVVLYEMLAGDPPYHGASAQAIIARVITEKPPLVTTLRETVPRHVAAAVHKALAKLPADRFPTAAAFGEALARPGLVETDAFPIPDAALGGTSRVSGTLRLSRPAAVALACVLLALAALAAWGWLRPPTSAPETSVRVPVALPTGRDISPWPGPALAVSPDGKKLVYVGRATTGVQFWLWTLDQLETDSLPGTLGAAVPSFSPDGRALAFWSDGHVKTLALSGGPPLTVADSATFIGEAWGPDGFIYYTRAARWPGISRVPAKGGIPEIVTTVDTARGEMDHRWVSILPNGRGALFTAWRGSTDSADIAVIDLRTRRIKILFSGAFARYAPPGYLIYTRGDGGLFAARFDEDGLAVTGAPVALMTGISVKFGGASDLAFSSSGMLAYVTNDAPLEELVWVGRDGTERAIDHTLQHNFSSLALAPDGRRVALSFGTPAVENLWVYDFADHELSRQSFDGTLNRRPAWSADGKTLTYASNRSGTLTLWRVPAEGGQAPVRLLPSRIDEAQEAAWSPDGRWLIYRLGPGGVGTRDLMAIRPGEDTVPRAIAATHFEESSPAVSPDGRRLAYVSDESGRLEVYVRTFPASTGHWQISVNGGSEPVWSHGGRELFYRRADGDLVAVTLSARPSFAVTAQHVLFSARAYATDPTHAMYGVAPDDQHFLMVKVLHGTPEQPDFGVSDQRLIVVLNWFRELRERMRAGGAEPD